MRSNFILSYFIKLFLSLTLPKHSHITPIKLTVGEYSRYNLRSSDGIVLVEPSIKTKKTLTGRRSVFSCCVESMEQPSITYQE